MFELLQRCGYDIERLREADLGEIVALHKEMTKATHAVGALSRSEKARRSKAETKAKAVKPVRFFIEGVPTATFELGERHYAVLLARSEGKTMKQIGLEMGVSIERIRQLRSKAEYTLAYQASRQIAGFDWRRKGFGVDWLSYVPNFVRIEDAQVKSSS